MKNKFDGFIWGMILIAAGGLFMARNLGYEVELTPTLGMLACGTLSALSFMRYFLSDRKRWARLIPACLFAAFIVMIGLSEADVRDSAMVTPLFIGLLIPFAVAMITDPQRNYWAIIPATIFGTLALGTFLDSRTDNTVLGGLAALVVAAPFFFVYFTQPRHWWAIIPAGILSSIGLTVLIVGLNPALEYSNAKGTLVSLGFAATFGVLYLRRATANTDWAKYPAIVFGFIALLALIDKTGIDGGPLVLIALGLLVLVSSLRPHRSMVS
ncbi:MAG TPA: hypothetical protein VMP08_13330 [Anaerolineae bacterium]|nr:hypothetical protein [Anaerolineae bacterium]